MVSNEERSGHMNQYNLQFEKLCTSLKLGKIIETPKILSGGLSHKMFEVETTKGKYAVKALNPMIMARPTALDNYKRAEAIVNIASNTILALPAKIINDTFIQNIDNQFYLIFDWTEGRSLKSHELNLNHCKKIGSVLAEIHKTDFAGIKVLDDPFDKIKGTDWNFYLNRGRESNSVWVNQLNENIEQLYMWSDKAKKTSRTLASELVISHRDLEPKNVMWIQENPIIIDWESAGDINPKHDLVETAIYWSMNDTGGIDKDKFKAFVSEYQTHYGKMDADWNMVLELGFLSKLDWLEYSLKRSLRIECTDNEDQEMGTTQVTGTINALKKYENLIPELVTCLSLI